MAMRIKAAMRMKMVCDETAIGIKNGHAGSQRHVGHVG